MRGNAGGGRLGKRPHEVVGRGHGEHLPEEAGALDQRLRGRADAAAGSIAQQRREPGRPGKPDPHRMLEAEGAQPREEVEDRAGVEAELGDDLDGQAGCFGCGNFVRNRAKKLLAADARMALRIAGNADGGDAAGLFSKSRKANSCDAGHVRFGPSWLTSPPMMEDAIVNREHSDDSHPELLEPDNRKIL